LLSGRRSSFVAKVAIKVRSRGFRVPLGFKRFSEGSGPGLADGDNRLKDEGFERNFLPLILACRAVGKGASKELPSRLRG
jgi:hypothetical protein